jgi:hypothetical protein
MFKLDSIENDRVARSAYDALPDDAHDHERCDAASGAVRRDLARQLHAYGAPDAPLEEQFRALLASHRALAEAGEEMPSVDDVAALLARHDGVAWGVGLSTVVAEQYRIAARRAIDLFAPILARRTQERDEWRERAETRLAEQIRGVQKAVALRQRAERAEQEKAAMGAKVREALAMVEPVRDSFRDALAENTNLRARIADLEALLAKACDYEATAAEVRGARTEPSADVVERLAEVAWHAERVQEHYVGVVWQEASEEGREVTRAGIRAVLSALAVTGEEAWPSVDELAAELRKHKPGAGIAAEAALDFMRAKVSPVLGALRARVAQLEANAALNQSVGIEGVTVRAVRRCMLCGGSGNCQASGAACANCNGTGYHE